MHRLALQDIAVTFRLREKEIRALDGVSLTLAPGDFTAIQGPSGCGKTTLLLAAGGLRAPDRGTVCLDGQDVYNLSREEISRKILPSIGFVFQQFHLLPYLTVRENVLTAALAHPAGDVDARATALLERLNLADRADHRPGDLSIGERQRTALARAMLNRPSLLLADEPTGNLDHANADIVLGHLADFARDGGSVLLVTHDDRAAAYAGTVVQMEQGKALENV